MTRSVRPERAQRPVRPQPSFGIVSIVGPLLALLIALVWAWAQPAPKYPVDRTDAEFAFRAGQFGLALAKFAGPLCAVFGIGSAIAAFARREAYPVLPVVGLLLGVAGIGLAVMGVLLVVLSVL